MEDQEKQIKADLMDQHFEKKDKYLKALEDYQKSTAEMDEIIKSIDYDNNPEKYRDDNLKKITGYLSDIQDNRTRKATPTGFKQLDYQLDGGLYNGLYVIGALSSLGKTSFALQLADNIAEHRADLDDTGSDVIYITFEMEARELYCRTLSRLALKRDLKITTREVETGIFLSDPEEVRKIIDAHTYYYKRIAPNLYLVEAKLGQCNIEDVSRIIKDHIRLRQKRPVVIIDYLQILTPIDDRATDKQNMDRAVVQLKQLSRDHKLSIIAISSLNRASYKARISYEAFKESGAIEYSSDVVIGLQMENLKLSGTDDEKARQYEEMISKEKKDIELIVLKNRNGRRGSVFFDYSCKYNLWKERS